MDIYEVKFTVTHYVATEEDDDLEFESLLSDWEYDMLVESDDKSMSREVRKVQSLSELSEEARKRVVWTDVDEAEGTFVDEAFHLDVDTERKKDEIIDKLTYEEQIALGLVEGYEEARRTGLEKLTLEERSLLGI